ncbi:MAG: outer membrane beta-barrel protein [Ginsengibacter sp.]
MKYFSCLLITFLFAQIAFAQSGSISGQLYDSQNSKELALATITVFNAADTTLITYRLSNDNGRFKVPGLPLNTALRFLVSYSGYETYRKEFTLTESTPTLTFDSLAMNQASAQLDEVVLVAERPPVIIKNDTIEFNANSFKTLPNALVEDLLKKLPGVQVDKDGNISVNGKPVNRMMVDGKNFFGSDPKMASRNLPADIIDKVQVTDDKEELANRMDDNVNAVGKVVNITLKKGIKKGAFGKLYAGGGTDERFETGGILNVFRDTLQVSLLGYANDLNKPGFGFAELMDAGGLQRSNSNLNSRSITNMSSSSGGSSVSVNGINFGGMQSGGGLATSKGAGININHAPSLKQSIFGQYFFGSVIVNKKVNSNIQQFNGDTVIANHSNLDGKVISNAHNIGLGIKLKPDAFTTFLASANYTNGRQNDNRNTLVKSDNNFTGPLSTGNIFQQNAANTNYYKHSIAYTKSSEKIKGRRISITHLLDANNATNNYITNSVITTFSPTPYDSLLSQMRTEEIPTLKISTGVGIRNPFTKWFALTLSSRYDYNHLKIETGTFSRDDNGDYKTQREALSSNFLRNATWFYNTLGFEFRIKDLVITPAARTLWQKSENVLMQNNLSVLQNRFDILPVLNITYKDLFFSYDKNIVLPDYKYLIPVVNNSNPYYVVKGNPGLLPAITQNFSASLYYNNIKQKLNFSFYLSAVFTDRDVVQKINVNEAGIQTMQPINADGSRNTSLNYNVSKDVVTMNDIRVKGYTGGWYSYTSKFLFYNETESRETDWVFSQWSGISTNIKDKIEWNNSLNLLWNSAKFTNKFFKPLKTFQSTLKSELIVRMPKHFAWETSANYQFNGLVPAGLPRNSLRLDAALNITMLKGERAVLRLAVWDLLNDNNHVNFSANRNMISSVQSNAMGRYFMATYSYNIRKIGAPNKKTSQGIFGY